MLSPTFSTASNANHVYAPDCVAHHDHRVFIGPLPRKALFQTELHEQRRRHGTANWGELRVERNEELNDGRTRVHHHGEEHHPAAVVPGTENDDHAHFVNFFREHALRFFIEKGGRTEDWNEDKEQSTLDAMMENWLNSEWGSIWARKMHRFVFFDKLDHKYLCSDIQSFVRTKGKIPASAHALLVWLSILPPTANGLGEVLILVTYLESIFYANLKA